jgi:hypothetical protein
MRTIAVVEDMSLDGVMQPPSSLDEDPSDGFTAGTAHRTGELLHPGSIRLEGDALEAVRAAKADGDGEIVVLQAFPSGITVTRWAVRR